jgi:hypothetical protein|tara:strand:+ start:338 stop:493 length:156 start_codon:yes stop_codon:yes gene_type:complete
MGSLLKEKYDQINYLIELYEKYQNKSSRYSKELAVGEILDALKEIKEGEEN